MSLDGNSFRVIYENEELVVVSKPHDVPMDGADFPVTVEEWAMAHRAKAGSGDDMSSVGAAGKRIGKKVVKFVHQLDYATSGVLCVAFSKEMAARLAHCFEMRTTHKAYLAILRGILPPLNRNSTEGFLVDSRCASHVYTVSLDEPPNARFICRCVDDAGGKSGVSRDAALLAVDLPVGYDETDAEGFRMAVNGRDARESLTYVYVLQRGYMTPPASSGRSVPVSKVLLIPRTGRRHQLRVHCHAIGFPILGDVTYERLSTPCGISTTTTTTSLDTAGEAQGTDAEAWARMMLHAWRLSFPVSVEPVGCGKERYLQKKRRRRETLGLVDAATAAGEEDAVWTHFETEDPFQSLLCDGTPSTTCGGG
ncbi:pseudouridylate synthase [Trypanosoma grayi]|uniref:pseudouridylate synthase n=1 Tax=Trypanosoma grayi TaxID=71804 RepID=UPI0004F40741|nr:pseudouridylate synthase [Trypanosoma grayi]KEG09975.1 pseudouridylate synthase [Trypanosoma grayi]